MRVWRISKARFAVSSFSGEGARLFDGRWNFAGVRMVYTSSSLALAAIEFFVHLDPTDAPTDLVSVMATVPDDSAIERCLIETLPPNWRKLDNDRLRQIGRDWINSGRSVAFEVPSAVVEGEWNVLLNPAHPAFSRIVQAAPKPFRYDDRMFLRR